MAEAVSDEVLAQEVREFLCSVWDLSTVTLTTLRQSLEAKLGCSLEGRKDTISASLREYIESMGDEDEDAGPAAAAGGAAGGAEAAAEDDDDDGDDDDVGLKGGSGKKRKKSGGGMNAVMVLAPELADIVGMEQAGRMTVVKKLWEYIRANNLQNPKDKRKIMCDEKFQKVFKAKSVTMFSMNKFLGKKMWKAGEYEARADDDDEEDEDGADDGEDGDEEDEEAKPRRAAKKPKVEKSAEKKTKSKAKPKAKSAEPKAKREQPKLRLSASMSQILGVEKASRFELVKLLWVYIKAKDLQNPSDKREIVLDAPLQEAFGVKTLTAFSMNKYLGAHLIKDGAGKAEAEADRKEAEDEAGKDDGEKE